LIFCGIDVGSLTAQAVLLEGEQLRGWASRRVLPGPAASAAAVTQELFASSGVHPGQVRATVATGYGRQRLQEQGLARANVSEISCHGAGARWLLPSVRTIIDIGGQDAKVIRVDGRGEVEDFVMNDKCASGTGRFLEVMSRVLEVPLEQLGPLSFSASRPQDLTSRCSIYCETEVLHCMQRGVDRADLAAGINRAIGERVAALARRIDRPAELTMTGGVAKNTAVRAELERLLDVRLLPCPEDPQIIGALGAAVHAQRMFGS
jgi:predicted CoA-substrate-specific enzyme activase